MVDIHSILADYRSKRKQDGPTEKAKTSDSEVPTTSEIPDLFFDHVLVDFKLTRIEIMVLMFLYRQVYCRPNLFKAYGISQLMSHTEVAKGLGLSIQDIFHSLRKIEEYGFISTVRSGQYFVRKYFTKENDEKYLQTYDDFEI